MSVSDKTNVVVQTYTRGQYPVMETGIRRYFQDELQRIETAISSLATASIQVADTPPDNPIKGMVRYAVSPWSPVGSTTGVTINHTVTVAVSGGINVYFVDGVANPVLTFVRGNTYVFDVSNGTNANHPLRFKDGYGTSFTTGVTVSGTEGQSSATVTIVVGNSTPSALRYYCTVHGNGMGNTIDVNNPNTGDGLVVYNGSSWVRI